MASAVDPRAWRPKYVQVADDLRRGIETGTYRPDGYLPSEADLMQVYDVSKQTVRKALGILESERLISREKGVRARVRAPREVCVMRLQPGDKARTRPASVDERRRLRLGEGEPVTEVTHSDGTADVVAAFDVEFEVSGGDAGQSETS